jgi:hypothetical protein
MITKDEFATIDTEVRTQVNNALDKLGETDQGNYVLFLADGEYISDYENNIQNLSPYCIDYRVDGYKDETRLKFLSEFMTKYYSFPSTQDKTDDSHYRMNLELMVYTHIWESKPFLKKLYRIAHLIQGQEYDWKIQVPDMSKHDFIRCHIRQIFKDLNLDICKVIKQGFHTSLRNAFAHSEYSFDTMNNHNRINLYNYGGANWELQTITFDEWSKRFVYSALLSYHFLTLTHQRRVNLISELGTDTYQIKHPKSNGELKLLEITYRENGDGFSFKR